jgi:hypothetical protein
MALSGIKSEGNTRGSDALTPNTPASKDIGLFRL